MVGECLNVLRECDGTFRSEIERLYDLKAHQRRQAAIASDAPAAPAPSPSIMLFKGPCPEATWSEPIAMHVVGRAAARRNGCVVDMSEAVWTMTLAPGAAVLVTSNTLEPVARPGQWALLASEDVLTADGDLAAVDARDNHFLRRVWSDGPNWILESINPVLAIAPTCLPKGDVALRKLIGVLYEPIRTSKAGDGTTKNEWQPRSDFPLDLIGKLRAITIEGNSLDPVARHGQKVLVAEKQSIREAKVSKAGLAIFETTDEGQVIKRAFFGNRQWFLDSPNPVYPHDPIVLPEEKIIGVWPLHGVIFESSEDMNESVN
jgi:hypothetical protein